MKDLADEFRENGLYALADVLEEEGIALAIKFADSEIKMAKAGSPYASDLHNTEVARDRLIGELDHLEETTYTVEIQTHSDDGILTPHEIKMAIYRGIDEISSEDAIHVERAQ